MKNLYFILICALILSGCISTSSHSGYSVDVDNLRNIDVGTSNKQHVLTVLGSPSTESNFGDDTWYYIGIEKETTAFFSPKIKSGAIVITVFNKNGYLEEIHLFDEKTFNEIEIAKDETKTLGTDTNKLRQYVRNIGKFSKPGQVARKSSKPKHEF